MNIEDKVLTIIREISDKMPNDYTGLNLFDTGILDSLSVMQIVTELSDVFDIEIDVDDVIASNFESVSSIVELVEKYKM